MMAMMFFSNSSQKAANFKMLFQSVLSLATGRSTLGLTYLNKKFFEESQPENDEITRTGKVKTETQQGNARNIPEKFRTKKCLRKK